MIWLTEIWKFMKSVPLWVYLVIGLFLAAYLYGERRYRAGEARVQGLWDTATTKAEQEARVKEAVWTTAIGEYAYNERLRTNQREQALQSTIAELRSGNLSVRPRLRCSVPKAPNPGSGNDGAASGPEQSGGLLPADAEFLVRESDRADSVASRLLQCQHYVRTVSGSATVSR